MMDATTAREVSETARAIARNIEQQGHYQGTHTVPELKTTLVPCCIVANPNWPGEDDVDGLGHNAFSLALADKLGLTLPKNSIAPLISWNDLTPTDEVLKTLREL